MWLSTCPVGPAVAKVVGLLHSETNPHPLQGQIKSQWFKEERSAEERNSLSIISPTIQALTKISYSCSSCWQDWSLVVREKMNYICSSSFVAQSLSFWDRNRQSLEKSWQTSVQYNITAVKKGNLEITQPISTLSCLTVVFLVAWFSASLVQNGVKTKACLTHTSQNSWKYLSTHARRPTEYPPPFLFILPEFGKRYLQE